MFGKDNAVFGHAAVVPNAGRRRINDLIIFPDGIFRYRRRKFTGGIAGCQQADQTQNSQIFIPIPFFLFLNGKSLEPNYHLTTRLTHFVVFSMRIKRHCPFKSSSAPKFKVPRVMRLMTFGLLSYSVWAATGSTTPKPKAEISGATFTDTLVTRGQMRESRYLSAKSAVWHSSGYRWDRKKRRCLRP